MNKMFISHTACSSCKTPIDKSLDAVDARLPCPACGGTVRSLVLSIALFASSARVGVSVKAKKRGAKKPHVEVKTGPSHSRKLDKPVHHFRVIDRASDWYSEEVKDYESGEEIHRCAEPLTKHIGHGTKKEPKTS